MAVSALRALLTADRVTHVPGVHDPVTAALAVRAGHRAVYLSGKAVSVTMLGRTVHGTQIADRASTLAPVLDGVPLLADADTGYDGARDAVWTALAYSRSGISGLLLSDRESIPADRAPSPANREPIPAHGASIPENRASIPEARASLPKSRTSLPKNRVPSLEGRAAVPSPEGRIAPERSGIGATTAKIIALTEQVPEMVVIATTGAYPALGLDETIVRCRAYAEAGAGAVLPEGVDTLEELTRLQAALPGVPLVVNRSEAAPGATVLPDADLFRAGVRLVLHPVAPLLAAMRAASLAYRSIADTGSADPVDRMPWAAVTDLAGPDPTPDTRHVPVPGDLQT